MVVSNAVPLFHIDSAWAELGPFAIPLSVKAGCLPSEVKDDLNLGLATLHYFIEGGEFVATV